LNKGSDASQTKLTFQMSTREKESRNIGLICSVVVHSGLLLCFLLVTAWSAPEQKLLDFGMAVNYGTDEAGWGDNQTATSPAVKIEPPSNVPQIKQEPLKESHFEDAKPSPTTNEIDEKPLTSTDKDATPIVTQATITQKNTNNNPTPPSPNTDALLEKSDAQGGNSRNSTGGNNGNVKGAVGDQGSPNGDINADALLGNGGGVGGGASLDMAGWVWDEKPVVNDNSAETGKIVFEVKIDDDGEVISVRNVYCTVSRGVAAAYEKAIYNLTFSPTVEGVARPAVSTGKITFVITSR
jgi:hypothetical protein